MLKEKSNINLFDEFIRNNSGGLRTEVINGDEVLNNRLKWEDTCKSLGCGTLINEQRYINKFFESVNEQICQSSRFSGRVILLEHRKKKIYSVFPRVLSHFIYLLFCILHRIFPKLPYIKTIYFFITKGRFRAISKMELLGRLYSCGFHLLNAYDTGSEFWFVTKKYSSPSYDENATYGPLIKLKRRGLNNQFFVVFKFRTMYPFSEYLQDYIYKNYGLDNGGKFKEDPRVTTIGSFFRKYWIDEIPMLWNLLRGDMKLIGPRPISNHYFSLYPKDIQEMRGKVRPGLLPPFYADLPRTFDDICKSEEKYVKEYIVTPVKTDLKYFWAIFWNIAVRKARSK
jgi:hypothetical protein